MSAKAVSEYAGKELLYRSLEHVQGLAKPRAVPLDETSDFASAVQTCEWIRKEGVSQANLLFLKNNNLQEGVIKPDQLIKRRGKHGLVKIGPTAELNKWFDANKGKYIQVSYFSIPSNIICLRLAKPMAAFQNLSLNRLSSIPPKMSFMWQFTAKWTMM